MEQSLRASERSCRMLRAQCFRPAGDAPGPVPGSHPYPDTQVQFMFRNFALKLEAEAQEMKILGPYLGF